MILEFRLTPLEDADIEGLCTVEELPVAQGLPVGEEMAVIEGLTPLGDAVLEGLYIVGELTVARGLPMAKGLPKRAAVQRLPMLGEVGVAQEPLVVEDLTVVKQRSSLKVGTNGFSGGNMAHAPVPSQLGLTIEMVGQG